MNDKVLCQLCSDVYSRNPSQPWQIDDDIELLDVITDSGTDTQLAIFRQLDTLAVVFRGTSSLRDLITDADFKVIKVNGFKVHKGFYEAWKSVDTEIIASLFQPGISHIIFSGHSLGGALALIGGYLLDAEIVTFGSPRVLGSKASKVVKNCRQYQNRKDPIVHCPPWWTGLKHPKQSIKLGTIGFYRIKYHRISAYLNFF